MTQRVIRSIIRVHFLGFTKKNRFKKVSFGNRTTLVVLNIFDSSPGLKNHLFGSQIPRVALCFWFTKKNRFIRVVHFRTGLLRSNITFFCCFFAKQTDWNPWYIFIISKHNLYKCRFIKVSPRFVVLSLKKNCLKVLL